MLHLFGTQAVAFRVLVVDDDVIERLIIARCVEMLGWKASNAANLDEATSELSAQSHDVVVIGLSVDQQNVIRLLRQLRMSRTDPSVIFIAGVDHQIRAEAFQMARGLGLRVAGTLTRPIDPYRLHALLLSNPPRPNAVPNTHNRYPNTRELWQALRDHEIHAEYQPKTNLRTGEIVGIEALARWHSPTRGSVPPGHFVAIAEQSGLISELTFGILRDAMAACQQWRTVLPDCGVAVNISPLLLSDPKLVNEVDALLGHFKLPYGALTIEITESAMIAYLPAAAEMLARFSIKGIRVSIDDFGTGYSSLRSLLSMPFTELKIDRSFVSACRTDPDAWRLVRSAVSLARELEMRVVAEGIESADLSDRLRDVGCDIGQGWFFARPMPQAAMLRWLSPEVAFQASLALSK